MLVAIPVWQGRVSPVFDVAERLLLVEIDGSGEQSRREQALSDEQPDVRARRVVDLGVRALICGAISRPLESLLAAQGVRVIARVCGNVDEILEAFRAGVLEDDRFAMPGCCGQRRRRGRRRGRCGRGRGSAED